MDILNNDKIFKCSVSSVLNKDVKQYGKKWMFDTKDDTSWASSEGTPQWIIVQFDEPQSFIAFSFQFQGGFVGKDSVLYAVSENDEKIYEEHFYPEDNNSNQYFNLKKPIVEKKVLKVKFVFLSSTDIFGRIIVYKLKMFG